MNDLAGLFCILAAATLVVYGFSSENQIANLRKELNQANDKVETMERTLLMAK